MGAGIKGGVAALLALAACREQVPLAPPPLPADRTGSMLLLALLDEGAAAIRAFAPPALGQRVDVPDLPGEVSTELWLLDQRCPLSALGLAAGEQPLALCNPSCASASPLPPSRALFQAHFDADQVEPWSPASALSERAAAALGRLPVASDLACRLRLPALVPKERFLTFTSAEQLVQVLGTAALPGGRMLFGVELTEVAEPHTRLSRDGYVLEPDGSFARVPSLANRQILGIVVHEDRIYLQSCDSIAMGTLDGPFSYAASLSNECRSSAFAGAPSGQPFEAYVAMSGFPGGQRVLSRFDAGGLSDLYSVPQEGGAPVQVDTAWVGPGESVTVGMVGPKTVLRVKDDVLKQEPVPSLGTIVIVEWLSGLGALVGSDDGELFRYVEGEWRLIGRRAGRTIKAILPLGPGGAVVSCDNGLCAPDLTLFDSQGMCKQEDVALPEVTGARALDDGTLLLMTDGRVVSQLQLALYQPSNAGFECAR